MTSNNAPLEKSPEKVSRMFDRLALHYDLSNRVISLGLLPYWKQRLIEIMRPHRPKKVLDLATGTADFVCKMHQDLPSIEEIIGVDISEGMLEVGREKVFRKGYREKTTLLKGDACELPFSADSFDTISCTFGIRNFNDLGQAFTEMLRVLTPGGMVFIAELSVPRTPLLHRGHKIFTHGVLPLLGELFAKDRSAYTYLFRSIEAMPQYEELADLLRRIGFRNVHFHPLSGGITTVFEARK